MTQDVHTPHRVGVVLVAAGAGERLGLGVPKAFADLKGKTLLEHAVTNVLSVEREGHLCVVAPPEYATAALELLERCTEFVGSRWTTSVAQGGRERSYSVLNGLQTMPEWVQTVLVHDAARPLASPELFERVIDAVAHLNHGIVPVLSVTDTVKRVSAERVVETLDRAELALSQTPQGFPREHLEAAYLARSSAGELDQYTDDAAAVAAAGFAVSVVEGEALAHKVTRVADLHYLEFLTERHEQESQ